MVRSPLFVEHGPQALEAPPQEPGHRGLALAHCPADLLHRKPLQVLQVERPPLVLGQPGQSLGQADQLLVALGLLVRRQLAGHQPGLQPGRRLLQLHLQRLLQVHVTARGAEAAGGVGQVAGEDLPQPGGQLRLAAPLELGQRLVRLQQRLLYHVRRIEFRPQARVEVEPGQQAQVVPEALQGAAPAARLGHPLS
jgi:hypothetical protein